MSTDDEADSAGGLFAEAEGFYETEKQPTFTSYTSQDGKEINLRLVGSSPLWGHLLWQAGRVISTYLEANASTLVYDKTVLELGAGAGLPSLVCAMHGAKQVVVTDYPDADLIANLEHNITANREHLQISGHPNIIAEGYLWGAPPAKLTTHLPAASQRFDLLVLADILFNHSQHEALLSTVQQTLSTSVDAQALVFFTPYRPWLYDKDMAFFDLARAGGFVVEKVLEEVMDAVMFPEDRGDEMLRRKVFGYALKWKREEEWRENAEADVGPLN